MSTIQVVQPGDRKRRVTRRPNFPTTGAIKAMGLYPTAFTPVMPGETLKGFKNKQTVVSAPTKSPHSGAWLETFCFHVRLTDIDRALADMFIGQLNDSAPYQAPADRPRYFTKAGQIDWLYLATEKVVKHFFLDDDESPRFVDGDVFETKLIKNDFSESMIPVEAADSVPVDTDQDEMLPKLQAFYAMRQMGLGATSYDEYLRTYGVSSVKVEEGKPELLAYRRYFSKPSNVIDPTSGAPTGAFYWNVDESNDKPKMFKEPGFVIWYTLFRPKVYDESQVSSRSASLWGFQDFFPSYTLHDPSAGIEKLSLDDMDWFAATGTDEFYIDRRDLLSHGEQFVNGLSRLAPPLSATRDFTGTNQQLRGQYLPTDADIFASSVVEAERVLDYEGLLSAEIAGHVQDNT